MKVLVISDTHINDRATEVPDVMLRLIRSEGPYDVVVFAGDLTNEDTLEWVKGLAPTSYVVEGNMDYLDLPEYEVLRLGLVRVGVIHGHQVYPRGDVSKLHKLAKTLDIDLLIFGHTHRLSVRMYQDKLLINPGSLTGAISGSGGGGTPSFIVMNVLGDNIILLDTYNQAYLSPADYLKNSYRVVVEGDALRLEHSNV